MTVEVQVQDSPEELAATVADALVERISAAQADSGVAHIVLTGGGIGTAVLAALATREVDWTRVECWWGDERFLSPGHPDRNATQARAALLDLIPIDDDQVHEMPADEGQGADQAARDYADELARSSATRTIPSFDVLLLGVGPEGHVASIFPDSAAATAAESVVAVQGSPKPPPTRITMTFPTIRAANEVWLVAAGAEKADAIALALDPQTDPVDVPAAGARGAQRSMAWLDTAASSRLNA